MPCLRWFRWLPWQPGTVAADTGEKMALSKDILPGSADRDESERHGSSLPESVNEALFLPLQSTREGWIFTINPPR